MDVLITSASRDKCIKSEIKAFNKHVKCKEGFDFHLHEDCVPGMENSSFETIRWANKSKIFSTIYHSNPRIGRGPALNKLKKHANSKYIFYMEEDFDFIKDVNLDILIDIMEKYKHINQIAFNWRISEFVPKPGGPNGQDKFYYENRNFDDIIMHVAERWTWQPAIWRKDWLMKYWNFEKYRSNKAFNNIFKKGIGYLEWNPKWHEENIGAYYYGDSSKKNDIYVEHTSWDVRHDRSFL
jgi:hypothetical protein